MSFLVVACFFLLVSRMGVYLRFSCPHLLADSRSLFFDSAERDDNLSQGLFETDNRVNEVNCTIFSQKDIIALYIGHRHKLITERVVIFRE